MNSIDIIKSGLQSLYKNNPSIHVNVSLNTPKISLRNKPVLLIGVYPHVFRIEDRSGGIAEQYTLQYVDVLTRNIEIMELKEYLP